MLHSANWLSNFSVSEDVAPCVDELQTGILNIKSFADKTVFRPIRKDRLFFYLILKDPIWLVQKKIIKLRYLYFAHFERGGCWFKSIINGWISLTNQIVLENKLKIRNKTCFHWIKSIEKSEFSFLFWKYDDKLT